MSVEVHGGPKVGYFYCTTSEVYFGPNCQSYDEACELEHHMHRTRGEDIRAFGIFARFADLDRLRAGLLQDDPTHPSLACLCGSGRWASITTQHGKVIRSECVQCRERGGTEPTK